ncbi:nascent polypeptide-associated complex subunit alpha, muscle-specific form-like [Pezoporus wallicus]|uniref:nascent polypeptide-associated complex subunit alpha, muscle-specific form-like n=1 Tax=Pezoporus wallicus TaxID=35540 RepID=UPI002551AEC1|nr:nascent polypeptide-associated complex subunit alpha, muscle-specific form-like [Pezoporus wallicus]
MLGKAARCPEMFRGFIELHRFRALRKAAVTNPRSSRAEETHPRRPPKPAGGAARPQAANATPADPPGPLAVEWHAGGEAAPPPSFPPSLPPFLCSSGAHLSAGGLLLRALARKKGENTQQQKAPPGISTGSAGDFPTCDKRRRHARRPPLGGSAACQARPGPAQHSCG